MQLCELRKNRVNEIDQSDVLTAGLSRHTNKRPWEDIINRVLQVCEPDVTTVTV